MDDELETTPKHAKSDNVAGISRSGRVRKKSMKLRDFESLDEVESSGRSSNTAGGGKKSAVASGGGAAMSKAVAARSTTVGNVAAAGLTSPIRFAPKQSFTIKEETFSEEELIDSTLYTVKTECDPLQPETFTDNESDHEMNFTHNESSLDSSASEFNELDESILIDKDMEEDGFQAIGSTETEYAGPAAAQSLYLLEKTPAKRKLVIKDGKIMGKGKSPRKDKGQPRVTAYMLWAKEIRQELIRKNPELDFSQTSKRLGELWATVPYEEQYIWKKRAKRLATKAIVNKPSTTAGLLTGGGVANATVVTTTTTSGVTAASSVQHQQQQRDVSPPKKKMMKSPKSPPGMNRKPPISTGAVVAMSQVVTTSATLTSPDKVAPKPIVDSTAFKPVGTAPLDIAAHLRLLGESLTIIGERLTEHDGQITVSGISSVLLDSLLCALAPLMCLTQRVPEMSVIPQERLSQMMDNIAYIMPGL